MALQVWLPLTKDSTNQGLLKLSMSTATIDNNGKLGKCAIFQDTTYAVVDTSQNKTVQYTDNFSWCGWFNPNYNGTNGYAFTVGRADAGSYGYGLQIVNVSDACIKFGTSNYTVSCPSGSWTHLCFVKSGTNIKIYKNGSIYTDTTFSGIIPTYNSSEACGLGVGCFYYSYGNKIYSYVGKINDFRIYDHCLSPKEVKEIAKGLVLHYPLNDAYVEGTVNLGNTSASYSNMTEGHEFAATSWGGDAGTVTYYKSGGYNNLPYKVYHKTASGSGGIYSKTANDISIVAGKTYTMSVWVKASRNFLGDSYSFNINGVTPSDSNHYITYSKQFPFTTEWTRISRTFTATESDTGMYGEMSIIYDNWDTDYYVYFSGFQIEEKDHVTPYTPNTRNETTVYDCSGYQNNGTITGALSCSTDSPRYKISTVFDGTSAKIINESFPTSIVNGTNPFTICGWEYCIEGNSYYPLFHIGSNYNYTNGICLHGNGNRIEGLDINGNTIDNISGYGAANGEWVYQCIVYDGITIKRYLNGDTAPVQSITCSGFKSNNDKLSVGGFWGSTFKGYLSDFRIYATALSAEDIKELYNTSAYVLDNGTLLTYNLEE